MTIKNLLNITTFLDRKPNLKTIQTFFNDYKIDIDSDTILITNDEIAIYIVDGFYEVVI